MMQVKEKLMLHGMEIQLILEQELMLLPCSLMLAEVGNCWSHRIDIFLIGSSIVESKNEPEFDDDAMGI